MYCSFVAHAHRRHNTRAVLDDVNGEIALLKKLVHPNIVRLREVIDDPKADKVHVVLLLISLLISLISYR